MRSRESSILSKATSSIVLASIFPINVRASRHRCGGSWFSATCFLFRWEAFLIPSSRFQRSLPLLEIAVHTAASQSPRAGHEYEASCSRHIAYSWHARIRHAGRPPAIQHGRSKQTGLIHAPSISKPHAQKQAFEKRLKEVLCNSIVQKSNNPHKETPKHFFATIFDNFHFWKRMW